MVSSNLPLRRLAGGVFSASGYGHSSDFPAVLSEHPDVTNSECFLWGTTGPKSGGGVGVGGASQVGEPGDPERTSPHPPGASGGGNSDNFGVEMTPPTERIP